MTGVLWAYTALTAATLLLPPRPPVLLRLGTGRWPGRVERGTRPDPSDPVAVATLFDLLAACLRSGLPTAAAVRAVVPAAPAALAPPLRRVADLLAMGADPATAWSSADPESGADPDFLALARLARRSARSGSSLAAAVGELAGERRARVEEAATARAERAGVLIGGPLGLCFLPAFICLGIVPVIVGLAGGVLGGVLR